MTKLRCVLVFVATCILGVSLGLPVEDVFEEVYDESESLPFEVNPTLPSTEEHLRSAEPQEGMRPVSEWGRRFVAASCERRCEQAKISEVFANNSPIPLSDSQPLRC